MTFEELYIIHSGIVEQARLKLIRCGRPDLANKLKGMVEDSDESCIVHTIIQITLDTCELNPDMES